MTPQISHHIKLFGRFITAFLYFLDTKECSQKYHASAYSWLPHFIICFFLLGKRMLHPLQMHPPLCFYIVNHNFSGIFFDTIQTRRFTVLPLSMCWPSQDPLHSEKHTIGLFFLLHAVLIVAVLDFF